jgi:DNA polymerase
LDENGLYYYTEDATSFNYIKKRTYGGKLVENAIQAIARDILAHGIINLERRGYPVLLTVHDENIVEIERTEQLKEVSQIMCDLPDWAKGCPISSEGFTTERYRKG